MENPGLQGDPNTSAAAAQGGARTGPPQLSYTVQLRAENLCKPEAAVVSEPCEDAETAMVVSSSCSETVLADVAASDFPEKEFPVFSATRSFPRQFYTNSGTTQALSWTSETRIPDGYTVSRCIDKGIVASVSQYLPPYTVLAASEVSTAAGSADVFGRLAMTTYIQDAQNECGLLVPREASACTSFSDPAVAGLGSGCITFREKFSEPAGHGGRVPHRHSFAPISAAAAAVPAPAATLAPLTSSAALGCWNPSPDLQELSSQLSSSSCPSWYNTTGAAVPPHPSPTVPSGPMDWASAHSRSCYEPLEIPPVQTSVPVTPPGHYGPDPYLRTSGYTTNKLSGDPCMNGAFSSQTQTVVSVAPTGVCPMQEYSAHEGLGDSDDSTPCSCADFSSAQSCGQYARMQQASRSSSDSQSRRDADHSTNSAWSVHEQGDVIKDDPLEEQEVPDDGSNKDFTESDDEGVRDYRKGGYHPVHVHELYANRYRIEAKLGWGHFSTVWLATDLKASPPRYVAIKFQKSAKHYTDAAYDEIQLLTAVQRASQHYTWRSQFHSLTESIVSSRRPRGKSVVDLYDYFEHHGPNGKHVCMVFEVMGPNLLTLIKQYNFGGVPVDLVRKIASHLLVALAYLHDYCGVIHTDLKPENVLVTGQDLPPPRLFNSKTDCRPDYTRSAYVRDANVRPKQGVKQASAFVPSDNATTDAPSSRPDQAAGGVNDSSDNWEKKIRPRQSLRSSLQLETIETGSHQPASGCAAKTTDQRKSSREGLHTASAVDSLQAALRTLQEELSQSSGKTLRKKLKKKIRAKLKQIENLRGGQPANQLPSCSNTPLEQPLDASPTTKRKESVAPEASVANRSRQATDKYPPYVRHRLKPAGSDPSLLCSYRDNVAAATFEGDVLYSRPMYHYATYRRLFPEEYYDTLGRKTGFLPLTQYKRSPSRPLDYTPSWKEDPRTVALLETTDPSASTAASDGRSCPGPPQASQKPVDLSQCEGRQDGNEEKGPLTTWPLTTVLTSQGPVELKPTDPMLFLRSTSEFKIADLGNGCWIHKHFSPDIQTRQYRSPEVLIGAGYDASADMWSFACTIFELITGDYLFEPRGTEHYSRSEDHLALIIELLGPIPQHLIHHSTFGRQMFDSYGNLRNIRDLNTWGLQDVLEKRYKLTHAEAENLTDFLLPMLAIDPKQRATAAQMLRHPWLSLQGISKEPLPPRAKMTPPDVLRFATQRHPGLSAVP